MKTIFLALFMLAAAGGILHADENPQRGPNPQALAEFDSAANGATGLTEAVGPVDRDEMQEEHRIDCDLAEDDELYAIDNALWYEHARKKGWIDED